MFLKLLYFASFVYLATSDPIAEMSPETLTDHQEKLDAFMKDVEQAYQVNMEPMFTSLPDEERAYLRALAINGISGYANYCMMRAHHSNNAKDDDVILQFSCADSLKYPTVSHSQLQEQCQPAE